MTRRARVALLLLLLACGGGAPAERGIEARVVHVKDGDSFAARVDGEPVEVRIYGIDAPERGQPWSRRARRALERRLDGRAVALRPVEEDAHGRLVAWVDAEDGACVACVQLRGGHAWVYRRYTDDAELLALEDEARRDRRGLWSLPERDRVPPWEWRRRSR